MPITYSPITTTTLNSTTASVTFNSLPSAYNDLVIVGQGKAQSGGGTLIDVGVQFNGDTNSNYSTIKLTSLNYASGTQYQAINSTKAETYMDAGPANDALGSGFKIDLFDYNTAYSYKNYLNRAACMSQADKGVFISACTWKNAAPITSITIFAVGGSGFYAGTYFALYGIKRA